MSERLRREAKVWVDEEYPEVGKMLLGMIPLIKKLEVPQEFASGVDHPAPKTRVENPRPRGLEPIRFAIEIPIVGDEVYLKTCEAVRATGYTFFAAIRPVSMEDLIAEDRQREQEKNSRRLGFVNDSKAMRATVPPEMEVAINLDRVRIDGSNYLSTDDQQAINKEEEATWKEQLPEDIRPFVSMHMMDPSTYSQLEDAYVDSKGGLLLPNYFARTDVPTVSGRVAMIGHLDSSRQRRVGEWDRNEGQYNIYFVPVVVLPRRLTV